MDGDFGHRVRHLRQRAGLSTRKLARLVPCSSSHINQLELGVRRPSPELAAALDRALGSVPMLARLLDATRERHTPVGDRGRMRVALVRPGNATQPAVAIDMFDAADGFVDGIMLSPAEAAAAGWDLVALACEAAR